MRVVEIETQDRQRRYVVIDDEGMLVEPIVRYLKYFDRIGAARNTLHSYAAVLKQYWEYLSQQQLDWQQITLDDLAQFVLCLKLPTGSLRILPAQPVPQARSNRTINHALAVLSSFYEYHWRIDNISLNVKEKITTYLHPRARRYKSFLHHITKGSPVAKNILKQKEAKRQRPPTITKTEVQMLLDACSNQRDRLLVWLLYESAMRVGEVLVLYVEDVDVAENRLNVRDRGLLENGAEIKTIHAPRTIDVSSDLIDEIVSYVGKVHTIEVETNHLFIKLQGARAGQALTYADVDSLFRRLRRKTSIAVIMRDKLRKVNPPAKQPRPCGVAPDGYNAALDLSHNSPAGRKRGRAVYWCAVPFDPRFRSSSVMAEVKGSCARVASRRLVPEHRYLPPTSLRRASAQAPGARCAGPLPPPPCRLFLMRIHP